MSQEVIDSRIGKEYSAGFITDIESDTMPPGLDEDVIRFISQKKGEPEWLLEWRLEAYRGWCEMEAPEWAHVDFPPVDYNALSYYSSPKNMKDGPKSLDEVDPELLATVMQQWQTFWWLPAGMAGAIAVIFFLGFWDREVESDVTESEQAEAAEGEAQTAP